ncbi:MAG: LacI family DNA-binding transcriptional regulator [Caldilineaceae bacterium]|nr:LacI family DNA-binding transcriptional regulator [Caldilineaceae bacterium]
MAQPPLFDGAGHAVTLRDIACHANVSIATVSCVGRLSRWQGSNTEKVLETIEIQGQVPSSVLQGGSNSY